MKQEFEITVSAADGPTLPLVSLIDCGAERKDVAAICDGRLRFNSGYDFDAFSLRKLADMLDARKCRTYAEICKELAEKLEHELWRVFTREDGICVACYDCCRLTIYHNGSVHMTLDAEWEEYAGQSFNAVELSAIAAACAEISANYDVEQHGKETQDHEG